MKNLIKTILITQLIWLNACSMLNKPVETPQTTPLEAQTDPEASDELYETHELPQLEEAVVSPPVYSKRKDPPAAVYVRKSLGKLTSHYAGIRSGNMEMADMAEGADFNTEGYDTINENAFHNVSRDPLSTFSVDVDTAAYANVRRLLRQGQFPYKDAVRIEEMINYFDYDDQAPSTDAFAVNLESAPALWNSKHQLVRIGIKGREIKKEKRPASNFVFLIDTSGSMEDENKLPLVVESLKMLTEQLGGEDRIAIVVYAGAAGQVLPPTRGNQKGKIIQALENLKAGGSTNGGAGIELAYKLAEENFVKGGVNRVILATDGDFNVGTTDRAGLLGLVEKKAKKNIYLSILGYGMGNYKDGMMQELSGKGNGNHSYIDSINEAKKVLVSEMSGTLVTIAKDVKIQVEFNPAYVDSYRLVGYENRVLRNEDFNDDKKDAGDIGAGHTVTALYEVVPKGVSVDSGSVDSLKYQKKAIPVVEPNLNGEWLTVKIRYKKPDGDVSAKIEKPFTVKQSKLSEASPSLRFASAVATFGMLLRNSDFLKEGDYDLVKKTAAAAKGEDKFGYRAEFIELVSAAKKLSVQRTSALAD